MDYQYPFGQKVRRLKQEDQTPKRTFVLGVYASAVHAKWVNKKIICQALAVASEPYIFWDGNEQEAQRIIDSIQIPSKCGLLVLPNKNLNGPSGKVLNENILKPLGLTREKVWLCDLLPESRLNPKQQKVILERYNPLIVTFDLNPVTVPIEDGYFCDDLRRTEITQEILNSKAETLILLGDLPIQQYLRYVCNINFSSLRDYSNKYGYGKPLAAHIAGQKINIVPIAHPRQIGKLGQSNSYWYEQHKMWEQQCLL